MHGSGFWLGDGRLLRGDEHGGSWSGPIVGSIAGVFLVISFLCVTSIDGFLASHPTGPLRAGDAVVIHDHGRLKMKNVPPYAFTCYGWESRPVYQSYQSDGMRWKRNRDGFCSTTTATRAFRPQQEIEVEVYSVEQLLRLGSQRSSCGLQRHDVSVAGTKGTVIISAYEVVQ